MSDLPPHLHYVFMGRVRPGDITSPEITNVQCWGCGQIFRSAKSHPTCGLRPVKAGE